MCFRISTLDVQLVDRHKVLANQRPDLTIDSSPGFTVESNDVESKGMNAHWPCLFAFQSQENCEVNLLLVGG